MSFVHPFMHSSSSLPYLPSHLVRVNIVMQAQLLTRALTAVISSVLLIRSQDGGITWNIFLVVVLQLFATLCSIGLCISLLVAFRDARTQDPDIRWVVNGKDLIAGTIDISSCTASADTTWFGRKRITNLKPYIFPTRHNFVNYEVASGAYGVNTSLRRPA